jgi:hypothetical protein
MSTVLTLRSPRTRPANVTFECMGRLFCVPSQDLKGSTENP